MTPEALLPEFAGRAFTTAAAIAADVPRQRLRARDLAAPFHGVRMPRGWPPSLRARCTAYAAIMPAAHAFSGPTAALLWGLPLPSELERDPRLHVIALDNGRAPRGKLIAGHRTGIAVETRVLGGCRVVAPVEAWVGLAPRLGLDALVAAGDRLLGLPRPLAVRAEIAAALRRHAGGPGIRLLRAANDELRENVYSPRETRTRLLIVRAGLCHSEPEPNGTIELHHGGRTRGDLVFRQERVVVEYEGGQHLVDPGQWAIDLQRYNDLALSGWLVIRLSKRMGDAEILARVGQALRFPRG
jgi:hypothetical protein